MHAFPDFFEGFMHTGCFFRGFLDGLIGTAAIVLLVWI
jgi:hypothetical protein